MENENAKSGPGDFGYALEGLRKGLKAQRTGWNG